MKRFLMQLFFDQDGANLAITTKSSNTLITASGFNTNWSEIEAVVNALEADNISADAITAVKLNVDCVRAGYGLAQHTDGSLQVDPSDTDPCLEVGTDGGVRVIADETTISRTSSGLAVLFNGLKASIMNWLYPVGSLYFSTLSTNPGTLLGTGTWEAFAAGKVLVGIDSGDTDFDTAEETGGSKTVDLSHNHGGATGGVSFGGGGTLTAGALDTAHNHPISSDLSATQTIVQPYIVIYMWKRTA